MADSKHDAAAAPGASAAMTTTEGGPPPPGLYGGTPPKQGSLAWSVVLVALGVLALVGSVTFLLNAFSVIEVGELPWPAWMTDARTTIGKFAVMIFAIALFIGVMTVILMAADRARKVPNWAVVLAFLGPAALMLGFGLLYPALRTIRESFFDRTSTNFVGWDNYTAILSQDAFQIVLRNTLIWVLLVPLASTFIGLVYAVLVDRTRFEALAKGLVFLPMAISLVGASVIWKFVYEFRPDQQNIEQIGLANQVLVWLGFAPQQFLLNAPANTIFLLIVMIWVQTGFAMTILSAAIKAIPDDIIEAARLDGLSGFRMFRYITVPSIRPALVVVLVAVTMITLKAFDIVRTMTGGNFQTSVVANEFYFQSFRQFNIGLGATLAVILFVAVIPVIIYQVRQLRLSEDIR